MIFEFPLQWPEGWNRAPHRGPSAFRTSWDVTKKRLADELKRLGAHDAVISTNIPARRDGGLYADAAQRRIVDPGVAIYFKLRDRPMAMARDAFWTPWENIHSIYLAIEHLRGLERHGGGMMMEKAFTGFAMLPPPVHWSKILGVAPDAGPGTINEAYRVKAKGAATNERALMELNLARDTALRERA